MNIVFLWDSDLNGNDDGGISLSGKYSVTYDRIHGILDIKRNDRYVDAFWGEIIQDCLAIVGDNGAGKTMLVNSLMNDIRAVQWKNVPVQNRFVLVVEEEDGVLSAFYTPELEVEQRPRQAGVRCRQRVLSYEKNYLKGLKSAYFCNNLCLMDYMAESKCDYDFSMGKLIRRHQSMNREMHYSDFMRDAIWNYHAHEAMRVIRFLYDDVFQSKVKIDFPLPKRIQIRIADGNFNEKYIVQETRALGRTDEEKKALENEVREFIGNLDVALKQFGRTWINQTIKSLILNCYKRFCIPQIVPDNSTTESRKLLEALNKESLGLSSSEKSSVYEYGHNMLNMVYQAYRQSDGRVDRSENFYGQKFIVWLEENEKNIARFENKAWSVLDTPMLDIPTGEETRKFVQELCVRYADTNFEFPFFDFSFGVSAGEFSFLIFFSNLYSIANGSDVYDYRRLDGRETGLLLIFDEADLSMHPKWQQMYIKWLTVFCSQAFSNLSLQIMVTTHSPILLSDFPADSILYVRKDAQQKTWYEKRSGETFGCNIHTLFLDSFFLQDHGTMGAFAEETINGIAEKLLKGETSDIPDREPERMRKTIACIGEGIIREKLESALERGGGERKNQIREREYIVIRETLERLKEQRTDLDRLIKELEGRLYD